MFCRVQRAPCRIYFNDQVTGRAELSGWVWQGRVIFDQPGVNVLARHGMDVKEMARMGGFAKWAKVRSKRKRTEIMKRVRSGEKAGNQRKR